MLTIKLVLLLNFFHWGAPALDNNVCKSIEDYATLSTNPNCFYNPDMILGTPELIKKYTGRQETYDVTTEDGYILQVFRMPRKDPKGVILLQHPMFATSKCYVVQGNQSTASFLWQEGYDVWMGNQRGTKYGLRHVNLTANDLKFWDFSFDETGYYDTPAIVDLVRSKTKSKIIYIGHSMGTTNGLIYASRRPDEAKRSVERFIFVSVSAYYKYGNSAILALGRFEPLLEQLAPVFGIRKAFPDNLAFWSRISQQVIRANPFMVAITNTLTVALLGGDESEADPTLMGPDAGLSYDNVSWKLARHFLQLFRVRDRFQMFDYGPVENQRRYGTRIPPENPIENIKVPIHLITSANDRLTTVKDAELLFSKLPEEAKSENGFGLRLPELSHIGIQTARHRVDVFVNNLMDFLNEIR